MRIGITLGDPKGIGPEIVEKALRQHSWGREVEFVLYGDSRVFSSFQWNAQPPTIHNISHPAIDPGSEWNEVRCGHASVACLEAAVHDAIEGKIDALVTAPICKAHLQKAGYPWPGHTEFLAERTGTQKFVMMMASFALKVTLVTIHVPLKKVPLLISPEKIIDTVRITYEALQKYWGLSHPRVAVCGLNPHAGEEGVLGDEEITLIMPALNQLRKIGYGVSGPMVPDAVFHQAHAGQWDAVVCMYHDQGLIPFKMLHFQDGVNVTLGLPIIRTSPDHGVAFDIAGKNLADPSSMIAAIQLACEMVGKRRTPH